MKVCRYNQLFVPIVFILFLMTFGCAGGGSIGTGGERIAGTLTTTNGQSLSDVLVTIEGTIVKDVTDGYGSFSLRVDEIPPRFRLRFEAATFEDSVYIKDVPREARSIEIDARFDPSTSRVTIEDVIIRREEVDEDDQSSPYEEEEQDYDDDGVEEEPHEEEREDDEADNEEPDEDEDSIDEESGEESISED